MYALDKVEPMISNYLRKGKVWKENNVGLKDIIKVKENKVNSDSTIEEIYNKMMEILKEEEKDLFN